MLTTQGDEKTVQIPQEPATPPKAVEENRTTKMVVADEPKPKEKFILTEFESRQQAHRAVVQEGQDEDNWIGNAERIMWTCCRRTAAGAPGCGCTAHEQGRRKCIRCGEWVTDEQSTSEPCHYHPGVLIMDLQIWSCCGRPSEVPRRSNPFCPRPFRFWVGLGLGAATAHRRHSLIAHLRGLTSP